MKINFEDWFESSPERVQMGTELELFLFDMDSKSPLKDMGLLEEILSKLPENIYRDYYPHQLEIRTHPHETPEEVIEETKSLYRLASSELKKHNIFIVPAPNITNTGYMWCGMHTHISYPDRSQTSPYYNKALNMYPFVLSIADHIKNFEINDINIGERMQSSRHIGLPFIDKREFLKGNNGDRKYRDIILSKSNEGNGGNRMTKPNTIEIRLFDTPSLLTTYESTIHLLFAIARHIKINAPVTQLIEKDNNRAHRLLALTRDLIMKQRYGVNKFFHMTNTNVCDDIATYFGVPFDRKTQFEFREDLGLSANINGYLSMAIEGGWLE